MGVSHRSTWPEWCSLLRRFVGVSGAIFSRVDENRAAAVSKLPLSIQSAAPAVLQPRLEKPSATHNRHTLAICLLAVCLLFACRSLGQIERVHLDSVNGWVRNLEACSVGGDYDRNNVGCSITLHGDLCDDGGC